MRYFVRRAPRSDDIEYYEEEAYVPDLTVFDDGESYVSTGILTADGDEIVRQVKYPVGFLADIDE